MQLSLVLTLVLATASAERLRNKRQDQEPITAFDVSCYVVADKGESYRGLVSTTFSGRTCQKWTDQKPWSISSTPNEANGLGDHNYCRNPSQSYQMPWCYTLDTNSEHRTETCAIPECPANARDFSDEAGTLANKVEATDCECADQLYGSTVTTKKTEVALTLAQAKPMAKKRCKCSPSQAAALLVAHKNGTIVAAKAANSTALSKNSCTAEVLSPHADLIINDPQVVHGDVKFCNAGQLKVQEGNCPISGHDLPNATLKTNGGASDCQTVTCNTYPCCMAFKCGGTVSWER